MPKKKLLTYNGITQSQQDWASELGLSVDAMRNRVKRYYDSEPDKCFSEYYLRDDCKLSIKESIKEREEFYKSIQIAHKKSKAAKDAKRQEIAASIVYHENRIKELFAELEKLEGRL